MESVEQVIAKIRSAPDDSAAMAVLKECGYALRPEGKAEAAGVEIEFKPGMSREDFIDARMGAGRE
jgi:hypothetical protein